MVETPVLEYLDASNVYKVDTDASADGYSAVLSQRLEGQDEVIAFFSKTFGGCQCNYCTRRELFAVILAVSHFKPYLYIRQFHHRTDHARLKWLHQTSEPSHQVASG